MENVRLKNNLIRRLTSSNWGASTTTLRTASLAIALSQKSMLTKSMRPQHPPNKFDVLLNVLFHIITGCSRLTSYASSAGAISRIAPAKPRKKLVANKITIRLRQAATYEHILPNLFSDPHSLGSQFLK